MPLVLQEVDTGVDLPSIARCMFESYEDPPQKFFHVFFPTHGPGHEAREKAIDEAATRLQDWVAHDKTMYWQKVVDTDTGKVAGGALWNIHKTNPFAAPPPPGPGAYWFPDDSSRQYVNQALQNHTMPRSKVAQGPHLYLFIIFTHPAYRRKGVGQQFMDWGMQKADELGFDFYLDSTPPGRPLYEANKFVHIYANQNRSVTEKADEKWKEMEEKVGPFWFYLMWRPVGGRYVEGVTKKPEVK